MELFLLGVFRSSPFWFRSSLPGKLGQLRPMKRRTGRSGITPTRRTHSPLLPSTLTLAAATSYAYPCMQVFFTVTLGFMFLGSMVGRARVIAFPKSRRALMGCPSNLTWTVGRLTSRIKWAMQPISHGFVAGPMEEDLRVVSMGFSWGGKSVGLMVGHCWLCTWWEEGSEGTVPEQPSLHLG